MMLTTRSNVLTTGLQRLNDRETMNWIPVDELDNYRYYPAFLKDYLSRDHDYVEHIITDERNI